MLNYIKPTVGVCNTPAEPGEEHVSTIGQSGITYEGIEPLRPREYRGGGVAYLLRKLKNVFLSTYGPGCISEPDKKITSPGKNTPAVARKEHVSSNGPTGITGGGQNLHIPRETHSATGEERVSTYGLGGITEGGNKSISPGRTRLLSQEIITFHIPGK